MRFIDLQPRWWTDGQARLGVSFACPVHATDGLDADGNAPCSLGRVYVPTEPPKALWERHGDDFATMSLSPSVLTRAKSGRTHWHGWVKGGQVSVLPDSRG